MENKANVQLHVDALRGKKRREGGLKYRQTSGALRKDENFCCLGVASDLCRRETGEGEWDNYNRFDGEKFTLTPGVRKWLGTDCHNPSPPGRDVLANLNDNGLSFDEIADIIEVAWL